MKAKSEAGSVHRKRTGVAPVIAMILAVAVVASLGVSLLAETQAGVRDEWKTSILNFGSNPVSHSLEINFARVAYIDQLTQWNTSGFQGGTIIGNSSFVTNTSGYGLMQYNTTTTHNALVNFPVAGSLGANVSYFFSNHRVALNGTTAVWYEEISEAAQTTAPATSGNVSAASGGAVQNTVFITDSYSSGNYTFTAYDSEWKHGGYDTVTSYAFGGTVKVAPLSFFNVYFYLTKTQTVISIVNTVNATVLGSVTMHPLLGANLTKIAELTDVITMASGTGAAMILDHYYMADHNTYTSSTGGTTTPAVEPMAVGAVSPGASAEPFDPASFPYAQDNITQIPVTSGSVNSSLSDFASITNSSTAATQTSNRLNASYEINASSTGTQATARQTLTTLRATGEASNVAGTGTLYTTSWTAATIDNQINSYLQSYVSAHTGIAANQVRITGYLISNITVTSAYSSTAQQTVSNYLASAIPGILAANHLDLVNTQTGAVDAGADIGMFWSSATHTAYTPQITNNGPAQFIYDPVNGHTYTSLAAAGFPTGSFITASGSIHVPGQGTFLGFSASGLPEFIGDSCFIVCISNPLSGAASAVSNFIGSAASTVSNAVGTVANTVSSDVIEPVSGTLSSDIGGATQAITKAVSNILPIAGGTLGAVGSAVSSTLGSTAGTLGSIANGIGSVASGVGGALAAGVTSLSNNVYQLGGCVTGAACPLAAGVSGIVNTLGKTVTDAGAVLSPYFGAASNAIVNGVKGATNGLWTLGSSVANAGMSALNAVGGAISKGAAGAYSLVQNAWGAITSPFINGISGLLGTNLSGSLTWADSLGGGVSTLTIVIIIVVVAFIVILAAFLILRHRRKKHAAGHEKGGEHHEGGHHRSGRSRGAVRTAEWDARLPALNAFRGVPA